MKLMWKKMLSVVLAVVLFVSLLPGMAAAEEMPEDEGGAAALPELTTAYDAETGKVTVFRPPQDAAMVVLAGYLEDKMVFTKVEDDLSAASVTLPVPADAEFDTLKVFCMDENSTPVTEMNVAYSAEQEAAVEKMQYVDETLESEIFGRDDYSEMTIEEKVSITAETLASLEEDSCIVEDSVLYSESPAKFTFMHDNGALGTVVLEDWTEGLDELEIENEETETLPFMQMEGTATNAMLSDCSAVILWSYVQDGLRPLSPYNQTYFYNMAKAWKSHGLDTTVVWEPTVDTYKNLGAYDVICIAAHGIYVDFSYPYPVGDKWERINSVPIYVLLERVTAEKDSRYYNDLISHKIGKFYDENENDTYCILPEFFASYYKNGGMDGTFVFAQCCQSFGSSESTYTTTMADAFMSASAESYIGFYNSVRTVYANNLMDLYVDGLIDGKTSKEAFDAAKEKYGENDWCIKDLVQNRQIATPYFSGNMESKLWEEAEPPTPGVPGTPSQPTKSYYPVRFDGRSTAQINIPWLSSYEMFEATVEGTSAYIVVSGLHVSMGATYSAEMYELGTMGGKVIYYAVYLSRSLS